MPIPLLIAILAGVGALAILFVILLLYKRVISYLQARQSLKESDAENIAFSINQRLQSGNYKTVYGIFNKEKSKILEAEAVESEKIDQEMANMHKENELAIME